MRERVYWCIVESWSNGHGQPAVLVRDRHYVNRWRRLDAALTVAARIAANWAFLDDYAITVVEAVEGVNDEPRLGVARERWSRWETGAVWPDPTWRSRILALRRGGEDDGQPFATACRQFRQREAVTQAEAAALLGVDERTWRRWENGESAPKRHSREFWRTLNRPAAALKVRSGT